MLKTPFIQGEQKFALWLACISGFDLGDSYLTLESSDPANVITSFEPANGWENLGSATDLSLVPPLGGATDSTLVGTMTVSVSVPGRLCLSGGLEWPVNWMGLDFGGGVCGSTCLVCVDLYGLCLADICDVLYMYCDSEGNCQSTSDYCDCRANNGNCGGCDCTTPVHSQTWGRLKASYR